MCSGQIARIIAERLNERGLGSDRGISRFVALVHTEGCGVAGTTAEEMFSRSMVSYLLHPMVGPALLLEHGCEKTHNDYMRQQLRSLEVEEQDFGWASVQMDGGIDAVIERVESYFTNAVRELDPPEKNAVGIDALRVALLSSGPLPTGIAEAMEKLTRWIAGSGGLVVSPANDALLTEPVFVDGGLVGIEPRPSLAYGERAPSPGLHIMESQTDHWTETLTGLAATGVELMLVHAGEHPLQGHPLVPVLQFSADGRVQAQFGQDMDIALGENPEEWPAQLLALLARAASRRHEAKARRQGNADFQFARGLLGVSM